MVWKPDTPPDLPLTGIYLVEPDGNLRLGRVYGRAKVAGMTREKAEDVVRELVAQVLRVPRVFLKRAGRAKWRSGRAPAIPYRIGPDDLLRISANTPPDQPLDGEYRVAPDGAVLLGNTYGKFLLKGLTLEEAENALNKGLINMLRVPCATVTLAGWEPDKDFSALPQVDELVDAYFRRKEAIELSAYSTLGNEEIVKRIGLTDVQRRALLRVMAENEIKWTAANPPYEIPAGGRTACEQPERGRKEDRKQVEKVLTPQQLQELKDLSFPELAPRR
jgi:hypothetical protein